VKYITEKEATRGRLIMLISRYKRIINFVIIIIPLIITLLVCGIYSLFVPQYYEAFISQLLIVMIVGFPMYGMVYVAYGSVNLADREVILMYIITTIDMVLIAIISFLVATR